ncbi:hypothetical protein ADL25_41115 [Streptomyces sp. NRRL F-5122]|nr:hypothetical protein ADL25_41115 [Streptomyces sp. NRRL F-5122]
MQPFRCSRRFFLAGPFRLEFEESLLLQFGRLVAHCTQQVDGFFTDAGLECRDQVEQCEPLGHPSL